MVWIWDLGLVVSKSLVSRSLYCKIDMAPSRPLTAVIDIGSNSVRLVVYRGLGRVPLPLFNEKVMCELGRGLADRGILDEDAIERAIAAVQRFAALCFDMNVKDIRTVATAAVREASNAPVFLRAVETQVGLKVQVISGEREAELSALGVLSGIPDAEGIMGDLGGGSLELVRIQDGKLFEKTSLPLGPLALQGLSREQTEHVIRKSLNALTWLNQGAGKPFYMVGGAWRALCHLHMHLNDHPLPIIHAYQMAPNELDSLLFSLAALDRSAIRAVPNLAEKRVATLPTAIAVLKGVATRLRASRLVASSYGLREGILYAELAPHIRSEDPLLAACREEAEMEGRFPEHGDILMGWMNDLFAQEDEPGDARLRRAACLLSDIAWRGHPDFRAQRALDGSLYGNYVGIDMRGRIMLAIALNAAYGGNGLPPRLSQANIVSKADARRALGWGLAIRLGQRLTGGTAQPLKDSSLSRRAENLTLTLSEDHALLYGEIVERRLKSLADALKLKAKFKITSN